MADTDLDLCNRSIGLVGGERLTELDDSTPIGEFCQIEYPATRAELLAAHRWVFAARIAPLTRRAAPPEDPRTNAFERPFGLVGAIHAFRDGPRGALVHAVQLADYIAAGPAALWAEFTAAVPEAAWPPWFAALVVKAFAIPLARRVGKATLAATLQVEVYGPPEMNGEGGLMLGAKQADGRDAPQRKLLYDGSGPLNQARLGVGLPYAGGPFRGFGEH